MGTPDRVGLRAAANQAPPLVGHNVVTADLALSEAVVRHGSEIVLDSLLPLGAEAGSAEAAFLVGSTYDPSFIEKIGAQGIKPDISQARVWYERAKALGHKDADAQLRALAKAEALATPPAAPKPAEVVPVPVTTTPQPPAAPMAPKQTQTGAVDLGWVEISSPVNVRSAPTPQAETIKVAVPGKRYQATARQGSWVQVTDPATSETGWVYARFVAASEAPNR